MLVKTYDYIWDEIIVDNVKLVRDEFLNQYDDLKYGLVVKPLKQVKQKIYDKYINENKRLKELYHHGAESDGVIDIHKIAACFTKVVLEEEIFQYSLEEEIPDLLLLINANLAYRVGIGLIRMHLVTVYKYYNETEIVNKLLESKELRVPLTNMGHDEYNIGRKKTLMLNDAFGNEFDILTYSDMLFWIEYYNRQCLEMKIEPRELPIIK